MLEPYDGKLSSTVLRGLGAGNSPRLPDPPDRILLNMKKRSKKKRTLPKKKNRRVKHAALKSNKIHFEAVGNLAGFATETLEKGETGKILTRGSVVSDDPLFYTYIESITGIFFRSVLVNSVFQFLILIHDDL